MTNEITPDEFFRVLKTGNPWNAQKIKDALEKLIESRHTNIYSGHLFGFDSEDKIHFLHDNDCYLFIYDEVIETRCDRTDVASEGVELKFPITEILNIEAAYSHFCSISMEPKIR